LICGESGAMKDICKTILAGAVAAILSSCGVLMPGNGPSDYYVSDALGKYSPVGSLQAMVYRSSEPGIGSRRMVVYLPPGYWESEQSYPVLYLLHGARGNETSWVKSGRIAKITDNLILSGQIPPCIIVLPNMNQYDSKADMQRSRRKGAVESVFEINGRVEDAFPHDVIGFVDRNFRTLKDKAHRAIAGLSIGGLQSIYIAVNRPEMFDYVGIFSTLFTTLWFHDTQSETYRNFRQKLDAQFQETPKLYLVANGFSDILSPYTYRLLRRLYRQGYPYRHILTSGGHDWYNWRKYFARFLLQLWPEEKGDG